MVKKKNNKFLNNKYILYFFILFIFVILFFKYKEKIYLYFYSNIQNASNIKFHHLLENIKTTNISINKIPNELKNHIICYHVNLLNNPSSFVNRNQKINSILEKLNKINYSNSFFRHNKNNLVIMDVVDHPGTYFPSIHTDIEWNSIENKGFQIWCLEKPQIPNNKNNIGNMFLYYNEYLFKKYYNIGIFIRLENNEILILKNCILAELPGVKLNKNYLLEKMSIKQFLNSTKKYYLNFRPGDCIAFKQNILHSSDYRIKNSNRISFNFRVIIKNNQDQIQISKNNCGYLHNLKIKNKHNYNKNRIIHNAHLLDFV